MMRTADLGRADRGERRFGPRDGSKAVYFHGAPGSAEQFPDSAAVEAGIEVLAMTRGAGCGLGAERIETVVDATHARARSLAWDTYGVIGISGGAPFALALAAAKPRNVRRVALLAPVGPTSDSEFRERLPTRQRELFSFAADDDRSELLRVLHERGQLLRTLPSTGDPTLDALLDGAREGVRSGVDAWAADLTAVASPWPFELRDIHAPVRIWHGTDDGNVPPSHGRLLAERLPDAKFELVPDGDHYTVAHHLAPAATWATEP